ncbi:hypothetical protein CYMTET_19420, partial [Cymbomonas tetramitiformis]
MTGERRSYPNIEGPYQMGGYTRGEIRSKTYALRRQSLLGTSLTRADFLKLLYGCRDAWCGRRVPRGGEGCKPGSRERPDRPSQGTSPRCKQGHSPGGRGSPVKETDCASEGLGLHLPPSSSPSAAARAEALDSAAGSCLRQSAPEAAPQVQKSAAALLPDPPTIRKTATCSSASPNTVPAAVPAAGPAASPNPVPAAVPAASPNPAPAAGPAASPNPAPAAGPAASPPPLLLLALMASPDSALLLAPRLPHPGSCCWPRGLPNLGSLLLAPASPTGSLLLAPLPHLIRPSQRPRGSLTAPAAGPAASPNPAPAAGPAASMNTVPAAGPAASPDPVSEATMGNTIPLASDPPINTARTTIIHTIPSAAPAPLSAAMALPTALPAPASGPNAEPSGGTSPPPPAVRSRGRGRGRGRGLSGGRGRGRCSAVGEELAMPAIPSPPVLSLPPPPAARAARGRGNRGRGRSASAGRSAAGRGSKKDSPDGTRIAEAKQAATGAGSDDAKPAWRGAEGAMAAKRKRQEAALQVPGQRGVLSPRGERELKRLQVDSADSELAGQRDARAQRRISSPDQSDDRPSLQSDDRPALRSAKRTKALEAGLVPASRQQGSWKRKFPSADAGGQGALVTSAQEPIQQGKETIQQATRMSRQLGSPRIAGWKAARVDDQPPGRICRAPRGVDLGASQVEGGGGLDAGKVEDIPEGGHIRGRGKGRSRGWGRGRGKGKGRKIGQLASGVESKTKPAELALEVSGRRHESEEPPPARVTLLQSRGRGRCGRGQGRSSGRGTKGRGGVVTRQVMEATSRELRALQKGNVASPPDCRSRDRAASRAGAEQEQAVERITAFVEYVEDKQAKKGELLQAKRQAEERANRQAEQQVDAVVTANELCVGDVVDPADASGTEMIWKPMQKASILVHDFDEAQE